MTLTKTILFDVNRAELYRLLIEDLSKEIQDNQKYLEYCDYVPENKRIEKLIQNRRQTLNLLGKTIKSENFR